MNDDFNEDDSGYVGPPQCTKCGDDRDGTADACTCEPWVLTLAEIRALAVDEDDPFGD